MEEIRDSGGEAIAIPADVTDFDCQPKIQNFLILDNLTTEIILEGKALMQLNPINQQVVAIVGASSGIGRETALKFAQQGAKVVGAARSQEGSDSLVEEIRR